MGCGRELNIRCAMRTGDLHLNTFVFEKSCTFKQFPLTGTIQRQHQSVGLDHQLHGAVFQLSGRPASAWMPQVSLNFSAIS